MKKLSIIGHRQIWYFISGALFLGSILVWIAIGPKYGLDFIGGSLMEGKYENAARPEANKINEALGDLNLSLSVASTGESGYILRFKSIDEKTHQEMKTRLSALVQDTQGASLTEVRFDSIGPSIGEELRQKSVSALLAVLVTIMAFVAYAFRKVSYPIASWKYGLITLVTLFHDVIITVGLFIVLGYFFGVEINTPVIAALLTILGYSVSDTIVVFDRVRENLHRESGSFEEIVEKSVNQTLVRSLNTSNTILLALAAILIFGGSTIKDFVLALLFGIIIGTYSSIFLASPLLVTWQKWSEKLSKSR